MNKTVFPLVMAVLTACPVLFSCTEKEQEVPVENKIYEYRFELAGDDTRAYLNDDGVFWELNDHVGLFTPTESLEAAVNTDASPKTIDVQSSTSLAVGTKVYAYYPYVEENTSVSASKVLFPAEQSGGSISAMPLAGIPATVVTEGEYNGVIRFLNLGSVIDFRVFSSTHNNEKVESISLKADAGNLAGTATIDLTRVDWDDETNTATIPDLAWADGFSTVTLTQTASVAADKDAAIADGNLYMVVAPGTYSGAITVTTDAARYTFPFTEKTFALNGLKRFNLNLDNVERVDRFVTINLEKATELVAGEKYVLVSNGFALVRKGDEASAATFNSTDLTVSVLDELQENVWWTLEQNSGTITRGNEYVFTEEPYFFGIAMNTNPKEYTYTVEVNEGRTVDTKITIQDHNVSLSDDLIYYAGNNSNYYIFYNTDDSIWDNAKVANTGSPDEKNKTALYVVKDERAEQNPQFSVATAEYDLGTNTWTPSEPVLSDAYGTVTYNSSDENVASFSEAGVLIPHKKGKTTITATASGDADYKPATASYELTVVNSNEKPRVYVKVTSTEDLEAGATYLIGNTAGTRVFKPELDGSSFKATGNALEATVTDGKITSADFADCEVVISTLSDGYSIYVPAVEKYLYLSSGSMGAEDSATTSRYSSITINSSGNAVIKRGSSNYYLRYSGNNDKFYENSSSSELTLYKLDDGRLEQDIAFSVSTAEYDLYNPSAWTEPTLSGAQGEVTYDSSDKTVATVNNDGSVTPMKVGTTTITATAAGNETYKPATASYTLTVIDTTPVNQDLTFTPEEVTFNIFGKTFPADLTEQPALSGNQTSVTYESSDPNVASVNSETGKVSIQAAATAGTTVTITATAAAGVVGDIHYKEGSASYTITITYIALPKYVKADEWENGEEYLIVSENHVLRNNKKTVAAESVTVENGVIYYQAPTTDLWTAEEYNGSFSLTNNGNYLRRSSSNLQIGSASGTAKYNTWTYSADDEYLIVSDSYYLSYSGTSLSISKNSTSSHAALYKLDDGRLEQKLSFSAEEAEYDLGTSAWTKAVPTLSGAQTTVTYGSSDETVATVDNNGTVTPLKAGTVTITATAAADEQYKKGTASYTLKVVNSSVVAKTYNRVSSVSAGTYLIIGMETASDRVGTYVCKFPPSDDNKCDHEKVSDSSDLTSLTTENDEYGAYEVELIASGSDWLVQLKSTGKYMYYADGKISFTEDASVAVQQITSSSNYAACIKNTNNDQFYHSGSNKCFMYSNNKNANNLRFFKLSE